MLIEKTCSNTLKENDVTAESVYYRRRDVVRKLGISAAALPMVAQASFFHKLFGNKEEEKPKIYGRKALLCKPSKYSKQPLLLTPENKILSYNNFYEFGVSKSAPVKNSQGFTVRPWNVKVDGLVNKPFELGYEDLFSTFPCQERIYRFRCVEAWSMNIPWLGFPLSDILKRAVPKMGAKYVAFTTIYRPKQMPGQASSSMLGGGISYPYVEGLRLDEAIHPLTLIAVGLYGKTLAPQSGAPLRLVVPWKYGFKSIKSIVHIRLIDKQPPTTWNLLAPQEYGFYANVNPKVDHPRWSQASERFIGQSFSGKRQQTLAFNGYAREVAKLYQGMNLRTFY